MLRKFSGDDSWFASMTIEYCPLIHFRTSAFSSVVSSPEVSQFISVRCTESGKVSMEVDNATYAKTAFYLVSAQPYFGTYAPTDLSAKYILSRNEVSGSG